MPDAIHVSHAAWAEIVAHAHSDVPLECCGLLIGTPGRIERTRRARNLDASPVRYTIDPLAYLTAAREARAAGLDVIGAYHSHPASAPLPSPTDLAEGVEAPFLYVIAGPVTTGGDPPLRAWEKVGGGFAEITLVRDGTEP